MNASSSQNQGHPDDIMMEVEARVAFISAAVGAFCIADEGLLPNRNAWEGFYFFTLDLMEMTTRARERVTPGSTTA